MKVYITIEKKIINLLQKADLDEKSEKLYIKKIIKKNLKPYIKMDEKFIKFDNTESEKYKVHQYKRPISIDNIDVNKTVVSVRISFGKNGFKYFIGYKDAKN